MPEVVQFIELAGEVLRVQQALRLEPRQQAPPFLQCRDVGDMLQFVESARKWSTDDQRKSDDQKQDEEK
jgi:hypothetical protein